jgi:serine/threonine-protein kinase
MLYEMLTGQAPFAGENINAIMYQTLNSVPPPPSTLSPAVPEMLNFIVAKALAKKLEHRYQDAKEFASDLYACRERLPRVGTPNQEADKPFVAPTIGRSEVMPAGKHVDISEDESKPVATLGLSSAFDSSAATMRLAALTGTAEDVEEFSKTFKMPVPNMDDINRAAPTIPLNVKPKIEPPIFAKPKPTNVPPVSQTKPVEKEESTGGSSLLLIVVVVLVLLGLLSLFIF